MVKYQTNAFGMRVKYFNGLAYRYGGLFHSRTDAMVMQAVLRAVKIHVRIKKYQYTDHIILWYRQS